MSGKQVLKKAIWPNSLALLALLCLSIIHSGSSVQANRAFLYSEPISSLAAFSRLDSLTFQDGDLILRQGRSFVSAMIARAFPDSEQMSHCGILLQEQGQWQVLHSISGQIDDRDGIRMDKLEDFLLQAKPDMAIHISPKFKVNRPGIVQAARFYLAARTPFDHDYDLSDRTELYCSELVRAAYLDAGAPDVFSYLHLAGKDLVDFASFFDQQHWQISLPKPGAAKDSNLTGLTIFSHRKHRIIVNRIEL